MHWFSKLASQNTPSALKKTISFQALVRVMLQKSAFWVFVSYEMCLYVLDCSIG